MEHTSRSNETTPNGQQENSKFNIKKYFKKFGPQNGQIFFLPCQRKTQIFLSFSSFSAFTQTKEHILFQAFQRNILDLGSLNNLAQLTECPIFFLQKSLDHFGLVPI